MSRTADPIDAPTTGQATPVHGLALPDVVVIAIGSLGDLHPFMALALAYQRDGRNVTFMASVQHAQRVQAAGLIFIPLATQQDYDEAVANPDLWHPRRGLARRVPHGPPRAMVGTAWAGRAVAMLRTFGGAAATRGCAGASRRRWHHGGGIARRHAATGDAVCVGPV